MHGDVDRFRLRLGEECGRKEDERNCNQGLVHDGPHGSGTVSSKGKLMRALSVSSTSSSVAFAGGFSDGSRVMTEFSPRVLVERLPTWIGLPSEPRTSTR